MPKRSMELLTESMFYVLMALRHGQMCGVHIADDIDGHTKNRVQLGPATLYTILAKFLQQRYISEVSVQGRKRTYAITDRGAAAYDAELKRLRSCVADAARAEDEVKGEDLK